MCNLSYSRDGELKIGDDVTYYQLMSEDNPATGIGSSSSAVGGGTFRLVADYITLCYHCNSRGCYVVLIYLLYPAVVQYKLFS